MRVPEGGKEIEYIALNVNQNISLSDLAHMGGSLFSVIVNGVTCAQVAINEMDMEPPMSGRFVFHVDYGVKEGDEVIATIDSDGWVVAGPIELTAEISIVGQIEVERRKA